MQIKEILVLFLYSFGSKSKKFPTLIKNIGNFLVS